MEINSVLLKEITLFLLVFKHCTWKLSLGFGHKITVRDIKSKTWTSETWQFAMSCKQSAHQYALRWLILLMFLCWRSNAFKSNYFCWHFGTVHCWKYTTKCILLTNSQNRKWFKDRNEIDDWFSTLHVVHESNG